jgi:MoaA/NifB/PqqE/SkfB family radical SAM enzyme
LTQCGLARLAVSLDGPTAETHDAFRRVAGSYDWILQAKVKVVQELLRHANSRITLDLYAQEGPNKRFAQSKLVRMVLNKREALA